MMNDDKNILEVYKKRNYNEYLIEKRAKIEEIENKDEFRKLIDKFNNDINKLLEKEGRKDEIGRYDLGIDLLSPSSREAIDAVEKDYQDKIDDRDRLIEEVNAQLKSIETYEQEMAIYKLYNIIDENGKIYDYKKD